MQPINENIENKFAKVLIEKYVFSKPAIDTLRSISLIRHIDKGEHIIEADKQNSNDYFLVDGILREYVTNSDGDEITVNFYRESIVTPNHCRTNNGISILSVQAITPSIVFVTNSQKLHELRIKNKELSIALSIAMNILYKDKIHSQTIQISQPAIKRLEHFRIKFPGLENFVPNSYIASYLGITNVSLSRLRNNN